MAVSKAFAWTNSLVFQLQHTSKPLRNGNFCTFSLIKKPQFSTLAGQFQKPNISEKLSCPYPHVRCINQETAIQHTSKPISETKHFREAQLPLPACPLCAERFARGHTPVAGRGGRISAGFFGALEANAAF